MLQLLSLHVAMHSVNGSNMQRGVFEGRGCAYVRHASEQTGLEPRARRRQAAGLQAGGRRQLASWRQSQVLKRQVVRYDEQPPSCRGFFLGRIRP